MRRHLILLGLAALLLLAGCTERPAFADEVDYSDRWGAESTVAFHVGDDHDVGVVAISNASEIELWRRTAIGGDEPLRIDGVRFRHPDGTVVNVSSYNVTGSRTVVTLPSRSGELAYAVEHRDGRFTQPMPVDGSARIHLPPGTDARNIALGSIEPGEHEVVSESPLVVEWTDLDRGTDVSVRYYDDNDPRLLIGLLTVLVIAAAAVFVYYRKVFDRLRERTRRLEE